MPAVSEAIAKLDRAEAARGEMLAEAIESARPAIAESLRESLPPAVPAGRMAADATSGGAITRTSCPRAGGRGCAGRGP